MRPSGKPERDDMLPITTRAARAADAAEITKMIAGISAFHGDTAEIEFGDVMSLCFGPAPWCSIVVAEQGDVLLGYAALQQKVQLQFARRFLDVQHLFVKEPARGLGAGRILIEAACEIARAHRCAGITLGVMAQNRSAQAFYRANGFEQRETSGAVQLLRRLDLHASPPAP